MQTARMVAARQPDSGQAMPRQNIAAFEACGGETVEALTYFLDILGWTIRDKSEDRSEAVLLFVGDPQITEVRLADLPVGAKIILIVPVGVDPLPDRTIKHDARLNLPLDVSEAERIILAAAADVQ